MRIDGTLVRLVLLAGLSVAGFVALVFWLLDLLPPKSLSFAAGRPGSAYHAMALRYRTILARDGITLEILETAGSVENGELLTSGDDPADAGFLQGGIFLPEDAGVEALAATFLEPLWIFHDSGLPGPADPSTWYGLRVAAGEEGSGTRFVIETIVDAFDLEIGGTTLVDLGGAEAAQALLDGEVDVALFVAPVDAPYIQPLFTSAAIEPSPLRDREALDRNLPFTRLVDIPRAGFDYAAEVPARRIELIAMVGRLVAREDLHPALVDRLVAAAREVHDVGNIITAEGTFPSTDGVVMPLNPQAANLLSGPPSALRQFLPYWIVAQVNRVALLFLPFLIVFLPLLRALPGIYQWRMRSRVYRRYLDLMDIDQQALGTQDAEALSALEAQLDEIETEVAGLRLPLRYREYAYTMRVHIDLVRRHIHEQRLSHDTRSG